MKKLLIILILALSMSACEKEGVTEEEYTYCNGLYYERVEHLQNAINSGVITISAYIDQMELAKKDLQDCIEQHRTD